MANWNTFFAAQVSASAALAGLVFVGVSINIAKIAPNPHLVDYALEALAQLLAVLVVSSLWLVPDQPPPLFGSEALVVGLALAGLISVRAVAASHTIDKQYRRVFLIELALAELDSFAFIIAGIALFTHGAGGVAWLVPGIIGAFLLALYSSWVLLIEINR